MDQIRALFPAELSPAKIITLAACALLMVAVVVSIVVPWWKARVERERINRGDY
ncbi:MAG TPA: hypothetical protein VK689_20060 [Armatimonadota bacterium]|nr:hypothetical protein [Armatimonadota bacterium]